MTSETDNDDTTEGHKRLERQMRDLQVANERDLQNLAEQGIDMTPAYAVARLETLIDGLIGVDNDNRLLFEHAFSQRLSSLLDQAKSNVSDARRKAILTGALSRLGAR